MSEFSLNRFRKSPPDWNPLDRAEFERDDIRPLHRSLPEYRPTPLIRLPHLARKLGVRQILVKDEAHRFGLKAFKALGGTYAIYRYTQEQSGERTPPPEEFFCTVDTAEPGSDTFCTATDGNHGRGVAWTARKLGRRAVIFMPANTVTARIEAIRGEGAEVIVVPGSYDEAVRKCAEEAEKNGWQIISDTSWPGYESIPRWIAAGYLTLFEEIDEALTADESIDVALIPAGVGALAAAAGWFYRGRKFDRRLKLISVEPVSAACMLESIKTSDGSPVTSEGAQDSIMAGLNCGTPSTVAWPIIRDCFDLFLAVEDDYAEKAVRTYYHPQGGDPRIISGESGAATLAGLLALADLFSTTHARESVGLGADSSVLLLNTEGDTDPEGFSRLVDSSG